jgi:hypothetical protein
MSNGINDVAVIIVVDRISDLFGQSSDELGDQLQLIG